MSLYNSFFHVSSFYLINPISFYLFQITLDFNVSSFFVMGYTLNLCKAHIYKVPYNHNIAEEGMEMTQNRIRIVDVADALGLSTATVSKVIHGKTEKISDKTVKRVQMAILKNAQR